MIFQTTKLKKNHLISKFFWLKNLENFHFFENSGHTGCGRACRGGQPEAVVTAALPAGGAAAALGGTGEGKKGGGGAAIVAGGEAAEELHDLAPRRQALLVPRIGIMVYADSIVGNTDSTCTPVFCTKAVDRIRGHFLTDVGGCDGGEHAGRRPAERLSPHVYKVARLVVVKARLDPSGSGRRAYDAGAYGGGFVAEKARCADVWVK